MIKTGVLLLGTYPTQRLVAMARGVEEWGYDYLWLADQEFFRDVYVSLALCAAHTTRIYLGPGVTDPYGRHPALTAVAQATLNEASEGRAVFGIGAGPSRTKQLAVRDERPAHAVGGAVMVLRDLLAGKSVDVEGEQFTLRGGRLNFAPPIRPMPIYIAGQRPAFLRLAGRIADGAIMGGCVTDGMVEFFRRSVREGAEAAGRDPAAIELVARIDVALDEDSAVAKDLIRPFLVRLLLRERPLFATFTNAGLVVHPALREKLATMEYTYDLARLNSVAGQVPDDFVDALALAGDPEHVARGVARLARSGIGQFVVYPVAAGGRVERTLESFQREVMPRVRDALVSG